MYQVGQLIIHGGTGVCRVEKISGAEGEKLYYTLKPLYQTGTITTPVDNPKVFSREVITREEALRLIDNIPNTEAEPYNNSNLQQLEQHYRVAFTSHDCEDLIRLTRSLYMKKEQREQAKLKFGAVDRRFMDRAEELLFGELAVALGIEKNDVQEFIRERLEKPCIRHSGAV